MIQPKRRQSGQALVEYAMTIVLIMGVFFIIDLRIRKTVGGLWKMMARDIAPGCPGCEPPDALR
jgi:hypothetical protein